MLARFYLYLKDKIEIIEARLTSNFANHSSGLNPRIFFFQTIRLNLALICLEILSDIIKFIIILFADSSHGFNVIFKQRELKSCPYSYSSYKVVQAKVKLFSFATFSTIVVATTIVSLITNLMFGGRLPGQAATYGWIQTNWSGGASTTATAIHTNNQAGWNQYDSKDANLTAVNGGADLQLSSTSASTTQTSDIDFNAGATSSTVVTGTGAGAGVQLQKTGTAGTWMTLASSPANVSSGAALAHDNNGNIFSLRGNSSATFWKYNIASSTWLAMASTSGAVSYGGALAYDGNGNIYGFRGNRTTDFWKYNIASNTWAAVASTSSGVYDGGALVYDGNGNIFGFRGDATTDFWKYNIASNTWSAMADTPGTVATGAALAYDGNGNIFGIRRNGGLGEFWKYNIASNVWTAMANAPGTVYTGGAMVFDGNGHIYAWQGGGSGAQFWKYSIMTNVWTTLVSPGFVSFGAALAYAGNGEIYGLVGNGAGFAKYSINDNFASSGTLESSTIDLGVNANLSSLNFNPVASPVASGTLQFQLATADSVSGPWTYFGPDGTSGTYFATSGQVTHANLNGHRYVKYKTFLSGGGYGWSTMAPMPAISNGGAIVYDNQGNIYANQGQGVGNVDTNVFWKYNISLNTWSSMATMPEVSFGGSMVYDNNGNIYAAKGLGTNLFWKYKIASNTWETVAPLPGTFFSGALVYDGYGNIYAKQGRDGANPTSVFWKYNIASDAWVAMPSLPGSGYGGGLVYDGKGNIYSHRGYYSGGGRTEFWKFSIASSTWTTMAPLPLGAFNSTLTYDDNGYVYAKPGYLNTGGANAVFWKYNTTLNTWSTIEPTPGNSSVSSITYDKNGNTFATQGGTAVFWKYSTRTSATPVLSDITINYNYYQGGSLTSSPYNSTDIANLMGGFSWTETLATSTGVTLYLRSASTSAELAGASWLEAASSTPSGLSSPDCAKDGGTGEVSCSLDAVPAALRDGAGDQWFQYKVALSSDGVYTPTFNDINLTYVVNATPEVAITNIPVTQSSADGKIAVDYQVRDTDTNTGRTPGYVNLTLEYCTANCMATGSESWSVASEAALSGDFGASTTVDLVSTSTWTNHSLVWDPNVDFEGQYIPTEFKLRLVANDSEGANNLGRSESNPLLLDTADPAVGPSGVLAKVDATANPAVVTLDATDDTTLYIKVGLNPDLSDAPSWLPYASTTAITLTTDPDTVYVQFKDEYNNLTDISPVTPETPINMVIRDLTNSDVGSFMEFIAWKVVTTPGPGFKQYNIWRGEGTDTVPPESYSLLATIGSSSKNYHLDTTVVTGTTYYYKIASEDTNGNQSYFSQIVKDAPDGQGGTDNTPPTIKQVEVVTTSTQSATIEWDTDELSDSLVGYSLTESDFSDMLGIDTMANYSTSTATSHGYDPQAANGRHRVTLSGLTPGTTYYFKVKSTDPQGNYAEDTNGGPGFSFETRPGPRMQFGPIVTSINNRQAVINWQTDILANATVVYATTTDFTDSKTASTTDFLIDQQVTVADLQAETKYYFYIKNQDELGNESIIKKVENGIESYYDFTTTNDANPPLIEEVTCSILSDTSLSIKWKTTTAGSGKPATARVDYGSQSGSYASSTETTSDYNADHTVELSDLLASSTYYFQVVSTDLNGNTATSSEYSCGTSEELVPKTEADKLIQEAKATGKSEGLASAPGGGIMTIDKTDKTAPIISDIRITDLTATSARVSWVTNEEGNFFVKYGEDVDYGKSVGLPELRTSHFSILENLTPNTNYNYQIFSADASGNLAKSDNLTFQTPPFSAEEALALSTSTVPGTKEDRETLMKSIAEKAISIITSMANQVSLGSLENTLLSQYNAIEKLAQIIPAPVLSGEPAIDTTPTTATIRWNTDKPSNSLIAFVPEAVYAGARGDAAYSQVVGDALAQVTRHEVKLYNLKPEVVYHYQLRSKAPLGPLATSRDFSFKTKPEALEITSYTVDTLSPQKTTFRWLTSSQTDTQLRITPFRGNMLAVEEAKTYIDKTPTTNHEQLIDQLESGTVYQVTLFGIDQKGIRVEKVIPTFSTTKDDLPPVIDNIQTESALSQGKDLKVQTAISWTTNEPTACSLKYAKGSTQVETDLTEETMPEASYSRKHALVITKFELGSVYSFRIYCTDSGDNQTISEPHAILTPKQRDSVFDLIINTMEQTFGWIGKLKG